MKRLSKNTPADFLMSSADIFWNQNIKKTEAKAESFVQKVRTPTS